MAAAAAGNCATAGQPSAAFAAITAVAAVAAEGLFYVGVAALWLLIVQWDLLDRLLGGPDLNGPQTMPNAAEALQINASAREVLGGASEPPDTAATNIDGAGQHFGEPYSAKPAAAHDLPPSRGQVFGGAAAQQPADRISSKTFQRRRPSRSTLQDEKCGNGSATDNTSSAERSHRSLYQMLPRALHRPREEKGVKAHMHRIVEHLSERLLPELGSHLGIEAGLAGIAAAVPAGIRDCGVRGVDRFESLMRRWAAFGAGSLVLYRLLMWWTPWPWFGAAR